MTPTSASGGGSVAHTIGPTLVAAFTSSPVAEGRPTGWASTRLGTWLAIDPTRTAAAAGGCDDWVAYALAANVLLVRRGTEMVPLRERLPFSAWIASGHALGPPTVDDLDYHLTTLFPPVRPRGFLEVRYLDALPDPWWRVAVAVVTALVQDRVAGDIAVAACAPVADRWCDGARCGLADPVFQAAAMSDRGCCPRRVRPPPRARRHGHRHPLRSLRRAVPRSVPDAGRRRPRCLAPRPTARLPAPGG